MITKQQQQQQEQRRRQYKRHTNNNTLKSNQMRALKKSRTLFLASFFPRHQHQLGLIFKVDGYADVVTDDNDDGNASRLLVTELSDCCLPVA